MIVVRVVPKITLELRTLSTYLHSAYRSLYEARVYKNSHVRVCAITSLCHYVFVPLRVCRAPYLLVL